MDETFATLLDRLELSTKGLSATETQAHPPGRWSIQQIVEHLLLTYSETSSVLSGRVAKGRATQSATSFRQHCARLTIIQLGYFPHGVPAPDRVIPRSDIEPVSGEELVRRAGQHLLKLDAAVNDTSAAFGETNRSVSHMILGPLSPRQWRRFHWVHGLHHIRQIQAIRKQVAKGSSR